MKKERTLYAIIAILAISLIASIIVNFNQTAKLKNGKEVVATIGKEKISADDLYSDLKEKYAMNILIDKMDHIILDNKYKTDSEETKAIESQISQLKANYKDEATYLQTIKSYYGVETEDEFKSLLSLEYKRSQAVTDYVKEKVVTDKEIEDYYNTQTIGDIQASHILIKSDAKSSDSEETKTKKEEKAKKTAEEIIAKLDKGEDFAKLAKKYSDDEGTASSGGDLGYFNKDDNYEESFVAAAAQLEKGKYTPEPIKTEYGYEIILKVAEKNKPKLEKEKDSIKETLAEEKLGTDTTLYYTSLMSVRDAEIKFKDNIVKKLYNDYKDKLLANVSGNNTAS